MYACEVTDIYEALLLQQKSYIISKNWLKNLVEEV